MTKRRAFSIHLTASATLMLLFIGAMWLLWFPPPYFAISDGWTGWRILAGVDVVLGPLLTLIVFKPGKPGLKLDMTLIVGVQLAALSYGATLIYQQRPAFTVLAVDRFTVIPSAMVEHDRIRFPELRPWAHVGPLLAEAHPPADPKERQQLMFDVVFKGAPDIEYRSELYHPYRPDLAALQRRGIDLGQIAAQDAEVRTALRAFLERKGGKPEDYFYFPLRGKHKDVILVLSCDDALPAGWIDLDPWALGERGDEGATADPSRIARFDASREPA